LAVKLVSSGTGYFPDWLDYGIHYMDEEGRCIFRYDNSPYHAPTAHHPHHKHVGPDETPIDHPRPSLAQIVDEVRARLYSEKPEV
jgi:hypothetical protein